MAANQMGGRLAAATSSPSTTAESAILVSTNGTGRPMMPRTPPITITIGNTIGKIQIAGAPRNAPTVLPPPWRRCGPSRAKDARNRSLPPGNASLVVCKRTRGRHQQRCDGQGFQRQNMMSHKNRHGHTPIEVSCLAASSVWQSPFANRRPDCDRRS